MKHLKTVSAVIIAYVLLVVACSSDDISNDKLPDYVNNQYPEAEQEIMETFAGIAQSLKDGDMDKLISFHAYSPKFTEFKNGEPRNDAAANEVYEREVFGSVTEVVKFDAKDMQISVYGDVANVTFHSDFHLKFGDDLVIVNDQISLLFVKTTAGWKIVNEHHSPLK
jgi:ketosteroid isomerase-like protein